MREKGKVSLLLIGKLCKYWITEEIRTVWYTALTTW